jgi:CDP-2,3-bis-(O-geranylgeranyl)-sn-glycerol synthase
VHPGNTLTALLLLMVANGAPVIATKVLGRRVSYPIDGNLRLADGNRLLGASKTIRGVVVAVLATMAAAVALGLDWRLGIAAGITAMAGDLFSSFIKRRLGMPASSMALGLDQIPESLFPLLACGEWLSLGVVDILAGVVLFSVGALALSRLLFVLRLRTRPY